MNRTEFLKILKKNGLEFHKHGSRHDIYIHVASGKKIAIPRHREITNKFVKIILSQIP
ncbi:MAG: type II toxin-antitoxin system HicA family toxin [Treponema sp.]|nr:type II toxin-antitoxin system HicA family toxin [Treponema sp.]